MTTYIKTLFILTASVFLFNCTNEKVYTATSDNNSYSRSIDTLQEYINLEKYKPINVMWKIIQQGGENNDRETVPGPTDYTLEAYIQFDRETADKLKNDFKPDSTINNIISTDNFWFKWLSKDIKMKDRLDSSQVFNVEPFAKSPLLNGTYIFINVNTILIKLFTT